MSDKAQTLEAEVEAWRYLQERTLALCGRLMDQRARLRAELREVAGAFSEYVRTHECAGGPGHDWGFVEACGDCKAPDGDCQNYHTVWCPTCLGCAVEQRAGDE